MRAKTGYRGSCWLITLPLSLLMIAGCSKRPDGILSDKQMEDLLVDMLTADAYEQSAAGRSLPDSVRKSLGESVLASHGVDMATLDSTYIWYAANLDDYYKLYSKVEKRLEKRRSKLEGSVKKGEADNSDDIWQLPRHIIFSPLGTGDAMVFELPAEAIGKGDRLEWKLWTGTGSETTLQLGIDYTDGSTSIVEREFRGDRNPSVKLHSDTTRMIERIYGVLKVNSNAMPMAVDSIQLVRLPFDSTEYRNSWSQRLFYGARPRPVPEKVKADTVSLDSSAIQVR